MIAFMITLWVVTAVWGLIAMWVFQQDTSEGIQATMAIVIVWCTLLNAGSGTILLINGVWNLAVYLGF
jgi:hypothetical protein